MKDAKLVALAEAQWIRSYVRLLMGSRMIPGCTPVKGLQTYILKPDCQPGQGGTAGPVNRNEGMDEYGKTQART